MGASAFIGRVGGLAVALGIGLMVGGVGVAEASPTDSPASTDEQATPDTARTAASVPRSGPARAEQSPPGGAPRMSRQARPVLTGNAGGDRAEARTAFPARPATSPPVSRPDTDPTGGDLAADPPITPAALPAAPKVQPAPAGAPAESLQAPPGGDPLAPAGSAGAWTLAAAARRELTPAGILAGPAASDPPGQGVLPAASAPSVIATISVEGSPFGVAVSPNGSRAYVATSVYFGRVSVIDTATNTVIRSFLLADGPFGVAVSPNGSRAYVTNRISGTVSVIDTATNTVVKGIAVGVRPAGVAVSPNGSRTYVTDALSDSVSVIDTATNTVVKTISVGWGPVGVAVSPNGSRAYVTREDAGTVSVIDTATNTVVKTISVGGSPFGVAVSPNNSRAYVTNGAFGSVSVIDTATNTVIQTIGVGVRPSSVAVSPNGSRTYVTNFNDNTVSVIDTATNTVIQTIGVGDGPLGVAVSPNGSRAYVANYGSNSVSVINTGAAPPPPRANTSPVVSKVTVGKPVAGTGVVTGSVAATDAEKDKLTYSAPASTAKGRVSVNAATGAFTYTPTDAARVAAVLPNANAAAKSDTFTVTVSDGYGGKASAAVSVTIAPAELPKLDLKANGDTGYLLGRVLKQRSNEIAVDIVKDTTGTYRVIAFIGGTGSSDSSGSRNVAAYQGTVNDKEKKLFLDAITNGIDQAKKQGTKNPEVMLVGYSQGGMDAQNIAKDNQNLNITTVVTFASPKNKKPDEFGKNTMVIRLEASEDRIPGILGHTPNPNQVFSFKTGLPRPTGDDVSLTNWNVGQITQWANAWVHNVRPMYTDGKYAPPAYLTVANAFDKSTDAKYKDVKANIDKFVGDSSTASSRSTTVGGARLDWVKDSNPKSAYYGYEFAVHSSNAGQRGLYGAGDPEFVLEPVSQYKQP